ncbi:MAG TPA: hypothetical protein VFX37_14425 [Pseudolabrys sp.]|nr:hypothetical protein [Pseudolabrys sp.]
MKKGTGKSFFSAAFVSVSQTSRRERCRTGFTITGAGSGGGGISASKALSSSPFCCGMSTSPCMPALKLEVASASCDEPRFESAFANLADGLVSVCSSGRLLEGPSLGGTRATIFLIAFGMIVKSRGAIFESAAAVNAIKDMQAGKKSCRIRRKPRIFGDLDAARPHMQFFERS